MGLKNRRNPGFYGARVEAYVLEKYGLERNYTEIDGARLDAVEPETGVPVETKAVGRNRNGGRSGEIRFKIWRDQHRVVEDRDGYYVFVVYQLRSDSVAILNSRGVPADMIEPAWYGETQPRGEQQAEIPASKIFG